MHIVHDRPRVLDPDDVSHCVIPDDVLDCTLCEGERPDGRVGETLEVVTIKTWLGVACVVCCNLCALGPAPTLPIGAVVRAVEAHAGHLGADLDEIAAAVRAKDAR